MSSEFDHARERRSLKHRHEELAGEVAELAKSAFQNEQLTRRRVDGIEALLSRSLWGKLRWLLTGR